MEYLSMVADSDVLFQNPEKYCCHYFIVFDEQFDLCGSFDV